MAARRSHCVSLGISTRGTLRWVLAAAALSVAGCSGDQAALSSLNSGGGSDSPMIRFGEVPDSSVGGRQVIKNPTVEQIMEAGPLPEMALGRADAPVTIIKYASLTCPYCRQFQKTTFPKLKKAYIDTGKVRFILREFPIGQQSGNATIALRCAPEAKYFELYGKFLAQQSTWVSQEVRLDPIFAVAKQVGITRQQFDACIKNQAMIDGLKWVKDRGRTLGIIGTPNFFVQGKLVKSVLTMDQIRALVDPYLNGSPIASAGASSPR